MKRECSKCGCQGHGQTWEVECVVCGLPRWPVMPMKPTSYTCTRCQSGAGASKREAGRQSAVARKSSPRKQIEATEANLGATHDDS